MSASEFRAAFAMALTKSMSAVVSSIVLHDPASAERAMKDAEDQIIKVTDLLCDEMARVAQHGGLT